MICIESDDVWNHEDVNRETATDSDSDCTVFPVDELAGLANGICGLRVIREDMRGGDGGVAAQWPGESGDTIHGLGAFTLKGGLDEMGQHYEATHSDDCRRPGGDG